MTSNALLNITAHVYCLSAVCQLKPMRSFDKKYANQIVYFNAFKARKKIILHLNLVTSTGFVEAQLKPYSKYDIEKWFFVFFYETLTTWPPNKLYNCSAGKSKLDAKLNSQAKVKRAGFHGALCQLASSKSQTILNTQNTLLTNNNNSKGNVTYTYTMFRFLRRPCGWNKDCVGHWGRWLWSYGVHCTIYSYYIGSRGQHLHSKK